MAGGRVDTSSLLSWIFFAATLASGASARAADEITAADARVLYFEKIAPLATDASNRALKAGAGEELRGLRFDAYGRRFELSMDRNVRLTHQLPAKASASSLRLYRGSIENMPGSWVRLAIDGGRMRGMLWDGGELYVVEAAQAMRDATLTPIADDDAGTVIFRLGDVLMESGATSCGTDAKAQKGTAAYAALLGELKGGTAIMQSAGATLRLELSAMGDVQFLQRYRNEQTARDEILLRLNNIDGIFSSQLGVEIQVPTIVLAGPQDDPFSSATNASTLLAELAALRKRSVELNARGLTHLFTGRDLDGTTVGIGYLNSVCHREYGAALTEVSNRGSWIESLIAAHEIGHNFGAVHDGTEECASTPTDTYLMSPSVSGSDRFSQCSLGIMRPRVATASCITDLPPANVSVPADLGTVRHPVSASFDWQVTVSNTGGSSALDVRAELLVPPPVSVDDAFVTGGSCTSGAGMIICQIGNMAGGSTRAVQLVLRSDVVAANSISVRISAQNEAPAGDNVGEGTIVIEPEADLGLTLQAPASIAANESFDAQFTVTNAAAIDAKELEIALTLPAGVSLAEASVQGGSCSAQNNQLICAIASLAAGGTARGSATLRASAGPVTLHAQVSGAYVDPNVANDTADAQVTVTAAPVPVAQSGGSGGGGGSIGALLLLALAALRRLAGGSTARRS